MEEKIQILADYTNIPAEESLTWDWLVKVRQKTIDELAIVMDVDSKYLMVNTDFVRGMMKDVKPISINAMIQSVDRINEINQNK